MTMCESSVALNNLCQQRDIWVARIKREFPEIDTRDVNDPRSWYLRQVLFGGEIYIHNVTDDNHLKTEKVKYELIEYNQLFERTKEIAEQFKPPR